MKILYKQFWFPENNSEDTIRFRGDYQADCVFHGLRGLLNENCVDYFDHWHMYKSASKDDLKKLCGKGFSLFGLLPNINVDKNDLDKKIADHYFDLIFIPIHHRAINRISELSLILDHLIEKCGYNKKSIIVIDGMDDQNIRESILGKCTYFKRELTINNAKYCLPINFAIPEEKVSQENVAKQYDFAPLVPAYLGVGDPHEKSYIYDDEETYYNDYKKSYFGYTCQKGGWDCFRHYEIMACGCIPFFTDIENCPETTMTTLPKEYLINIKKMRGIKPGTYFPYNANIRTFIGTTKFIKSGEERGCINHEQFYHDLYDSFRNWLHKYTKENLTTVALAKRILTKVLN